MQKLILLIITVLFITKISAEELIEAKKELILTNVIGKGDICFSILENPEGSYGTGSPIIDSEGNIMFFQNSYINQKLIKYQNGKWSSFEYPDFIPDSFFMQQNIQNSQNGVVFEKIGKSIIENKLFDYYEGLISYTSYSVPEGLVYCLKMAKNNQKIIGVQVNLSYDSVIKNNNIIFELIEESECNKWLSNQCGSYTISDNNLYRKGFKWNEVRPENLSGKYIGKIKSGHNVYETKNTLIISDSKGVVELKVTIPWKDSNPYIWGLGNWGEIYMVIAPAYDKKNLVSYYDSEYYRAADNEIVEVIAIRNYLKFFGILNDDRIRLRKGPGTDTESLGTYPIKTGFRILEDSGVKQTIDGQTYSWIKVRLLDGTEGYFYGQYIQNLYDGPGTPLPWPNVADWD